MTGIKTANNTAEPNEVVNKKDWVSGVFS